MVNKWNIYLQFFLAFFGKIALNPSRYWEKSHETIPLSCPLLFSLSVLSEDEEDSHDLLYSLSNQESIPEKKKKTYPANKSVRPSVKTLSLKNILPTI